MLQRSVIVPIDAVNFDAADSGGDRRGGLRNGGTVSVVIPTFNCASFIVEAIKSAFEQSHFTTEVIVVDDKSCDGTEQVVARSGFPVRYVRNRANLGVSASRNVGITVARGDLIAFLDADDVWLPSKLSRQVAVLAAHPDLVAIGGLMIPYEDDVPQSDDESTPLVRYSFTEMVFKNRLATPTVVARRHCLLRAGLFDESMNNSEDYDLWLRLAQIGTIGVLRSALARYRRRSDGLSAANPDKTHRLYMDYCRSLRTRFKGVVSYRVWRRALAARELERATTLCDEECRLGWAALRTLRSIAYWPLERPLLESPRFARLRRLRRIALRCAMRLIGGRTLRTR